VSSNGVMVTRAMAANAGLDPQRDISIVVIGEGAQAAAQLKNKQADAYSAFDTAYVLVENAGVALRDLPNADVSKFPSSGMYALEENISGKRAQLVALGRAFAMGQVFAMANPEAAVHILWEIFPQTQPTGIDEVSALANEIKLLKARAESVEPRRRPDGRQALGRKRRRQLSSLLRLAAAAERDQAEARCQGGFHQRVDRR